MSADHPTHPALEQVNLAATALNNAIVEGQALLERQVELPSTIRSFSANARKLGEGFDAARPSYAQTFEALPKQFAPLSVQAQQVLRHYKRDFDKVASGQRRRGFIAQFGTMLLIMLVIAALALGVALFWDQIYALIEPLLNTSSTQPTALPQTSGGE